MANNTRGRSNEQYCMKAREPDTSFASFSHVLERKSEQHDVGQATMHKGTRLCTYPNHSQHMCSQLLCAGHDGYYNRSQPNTTQWTPLHQVCPHGPHLAPSGVPCPAHTCLSHLLCAAPLACCTCAGVGCAAAGVLAGQDSTTRAGSRKTSAGRGVEATTRHNPADTTTHAVPETLMVHTDWATSQSYRNQP